MAKLFLLAFLLLLPVQAGQKEESFPGGTLKIYQNAFVWESKDASGILPANIKREVEVKIQSILAGPDSIKLLIEVYTNDGHYEILPVNLQGAKALGKGLKRFGFVE